MNNQKSRFGKVIIVCSHDAVTGGPEAMHQLCDKLNKFGCNAYMAYFAATLQISRDKIISEAPTERVTRAYSHYKTLFSESLDLMEGDLIIFPEILASFAASNYACQIAIWWLSVDNALNWNPRLKYASISQPIFINPVYHLYQSMYARKFLQDNRARMLAPLYDYTQQVEDPTIQPAQDTQKPYDIAIFPLKGGDLAQKFISNEESLKFILLQGITKEQVKENLLRTQIYIDFGHQPGKDRVPREAAVSDCVVFLHRQGAGANYEDCPLDDFFLFTSEDVISGNLAQRIHLTLENINEIKMMQGNYRNKIKNEEIEFEIQCRNFFMVD